MTEQQVDQRPSQQQRNQPQGATAGDAPADPMRVLVVGGAGHVGGILRPVLEQRHRIAYMDISPVADAEDQTVVGSVTDARAVKEATRDVDAVIYLAMGIAYGESEDAQSDNGGPDAVQRCFDVNAQGVYRVLREALENGARRFVYASTLSVYGFRRPTPITEAHPPNAWRPYGLTKRLGEHVCEIAGMNYPDATIVGLRLVHPLSAEQHEKRQAWLDAGSTGPPPNLRGLTAPRKKKRAQQQNARTGAKRGGWIRAGIGPTDLQRLFLAALELQQPGVHFVQASGDQTGDLCPNGGAHALLGWTPQGE